MNDLISVIIPVYNAGAEQLTRAVNSVLCQTYTNIELLLVDDKSTKSHIAPLLDNFKQRDSRVKIFANEENSGASMTRKKGIDNANGDYILFMDNDDSLTNNSVELLIGRAKDTNADIVVGSIIFNYGEYRKECIYTLREDNPCAYLTAALNDNIRRTLWGNLIKKATIQNSGFPVAAKNAFDNDIYVCFHFACSNVKIVTLETPILIYNFSYSSYSHSRPLKCLEDLHLYDRQIENLLKSKSYFKNIKDDFAYYMICSFIEKFNTFNGAELDMSLYGEYLKNKEAVKRLSRNKKLMLIVYNNTLLRSIYVLYVQQIKSVLKKKFHRIYLKLTSSQLRYCAI